MEAMNATDNHQEKIMKLSIAELMSIPAISPAASAFADATGAEYHNPDFEPGQDVAYLVAALIDKWHSEITPIGQETPILTVQTPDSFAKECNASYKSVEAAKAAFRLMRLDLPSAWSDSQF